MPTEETSSLSRAECAVAASRLESLAAELRRAESLEMPEIWVFRKRSLDIALERAESFKHELLRAIQAIELGKPFGPNSEKGRKPAAQVSKKRRRHDQQVIDEVDQELAAEANRRAAKKASRKKTSGKKKRGSG